MLLTNRIEFRLTLLLWAIVLMLEGTLIATTNPAVGEVFQQVGFVLVIGHGIVFIVDRVKIAKRL